MTEALEYYKCNVCGNFVEIVLPGAGELVCCSQPMEKVKTQDSSEEMTGEKPILLLDDVLSELDENRQRYLMQSIEGLQSFLTCTGIEDSIRRYVQTDNLFYVQNGRISRP